MNNTSIALRLAIVAITAVINYGCLAVIYRLIVRDMRLAREDVPRIAGVYMVFNAIYAALCLLAVAWILIESGYTK